MGSPAPGCLFSVNVANRLLMTGETLVLSNHKGALRAFSSTVKPLHPSLSHSHTKFTSSVTNPTLGSPWTGWRLQGCLGGSQPHQPPWMLPLSWACIPSGSPQLCISPNTLLSLLSLAKPSAWPQLLAKVPTDPGCLHPSQTWGPSPASSS